MRERKGWRPTPVYPKRPCRRAGAWEARPFGLWVGADGKVKAKGMVDRREHLESLLLAAEIGHPSIQSYVTALAEEEEQKRQREASGRLGDTHLGPRELKGANE